MTSAQALAGLVASFRQGGVSVTSLGVGADFNEDLMQRLADVGGGSYAFIQEKDPGAMARLFEGDLQQAGTLVAQGASLTFTLPAGMRFVEVYGRTGVVEDGQVRVTLPDFSARQREKLVVHLQATVQAREGAVPVADVRLAYTDVLAGRATGAQLALAAAATTDPALAARPAAPEVLVQVGRARAGANYRAAAEALDKGDAAEARRALARNAAVLDEVERVAGAGSMAEEKSAGEVMFGLSSAPAAARPEAVKLMKVQSLQSAGRGESVRK
jgi:Ca-activated chloride channel family protein